MNLNILKNLILVSSLGIFAVGCSSVRVVSLSKEGGELALLGDREGAMEKAQTEMALKCGGREKFEIVEQGEVVVGSVTQSRAQTSSRKGRRGSRRGYASSTSTTQDKTEWRVIFECLSDKPDEVARQHTLSIPLSL